MVGESHLKKVGQQESGGKRYKNWIGETSLIQNGIGDESYKNWIGDLPGKVTKMG